MALAAQLSQESTNRMDVTWDMTPGEEQARGAGAIDISQDQRVVDWLASEPHFAYHNFDNTAFLADIGQFTQALQANEVGNLRREEDLQQLYWDLAQESGNRQEGIDPSNRSPGELRARGTGQLDLTQDPRMQEMAQRLEDAGYSADQIAAVMGYGAAVQAGERAFLDDVSEAARLERERRSLLPDLRRESEMQAAEGPRHQFDVEGEGAAAGITRVN